MRVGSSPLVRGSALSRQLSCLRCRFIPARAGIGFMSSVAKNRSPVHPRSCGDRFIESVRFDSNGGSSPLVRGSGVMKCKLRVTRRFIPARAGIGPTCFSVAQPGSVHPRSCGDRLPSMPTYWSPNGSSPLVRGSGVIPKRTVDFQRFIPARAGIGIRPNGNSGR